MCGAVGEQIFRRHGAPIISAFNPVQQLYEAALLALDPDGHTDDYVLNRLADAVQKIEDCAEVSEGLKTVRLYAELMYGRSEAAGGEIQIDDAAFTHHNGTDGYWVWAWLWVPDNTQEQPRVM